MERILAWTIALHGLVTMTAGYMAAIELGIARFRIINRRIASEGQSCDNDHAGGVYNPCDFEFYIEDCRRDSTLDFNCQMKVGRFFSQPNQDYVIFNNSVPRPQTLFSLIGGFPRTLMANVSVYDDDDDYSRDDYVGTYRLFFTPNMLNKGGRQFADEIEHIITIPDHSEMVLSYRAYCLDVECRNAPTYSAQYDVGPQVAQSLQTLQQVGQPQFVISQPVVLSSFGGNVPWSSWSSWNSQYPNSWTSWGGVVGGTYTYPWSSWGSYPYPWTSWGGVIGGGYPWTSWGGVIGGYPWTAWGVPWTQWGSFINPAGVINPYQQWISWGAFNQWSTWSLGGWTPWSNAPIWNAWTQFGVPGFGQPGIWGGWGGVVQFPPTQFGPGQQFPGQWGAWGTNPFLSSTLWSQWGVPWTQWGSTGLGVGSLGVFGQPWSQWGVGSLGVLGQQPWGQWGVASASFPLGRRRRRVANQL